MLRRPGSETQAPVQAPWGLIHGRTVGYEPGGTFCSERQQTTFIRSRKSQEGTNLCQTLISNASCKHKNLDMKHFYTHYTGERTGSEREQGLAGMPRKQRGAGLPTARKGWPAVLLIYTTRP